jgi:ABC-2 type transport system ATP-binding protein
MKSKEATTVGGDAMTAADGIVLEARDVHKAYGRHQVLNGAGLEVRAGQLVAVVGENGSGKSTLLRILAGTLAADHGVVRVTGTIGYCPQEPVVSDNLTVGQHLLYFAAAARLASLRRADELVELLRFGQFRDRAVGALSGGTRQKLNLTLALLHDPDVLLLDEPYQGFDWETYLRFWDVVGDLRSRGKAVVIITHLVIEQDRFDMLAGLADGRLTRHDAPTEDPHGSH